MNLTRLQSSTSSAILSHLCYHPSWLLGLGNLLPHLDTTGPLLAGWVSIKWRGLTIKWRCLTPHLHHNTVALWERAEELEQQGSEPAFRSHLSSHSSSHSSAKFYFLYYPFTSLLPSLLTSWFGQPPATSWHDWALAGRVGLYKMEGSNPPPAPQHYCSVGEQRNWSSRGQNQHSEAISALTLLQSSTSPAILSHLCYHPSWLLGLGNLLPHLATTCHDWALAGRVGLYKMEGSNPPPAP